MFVTGALLFLSAALLAALLIWRRQHFSYFERIGIPGPKPSLIWGNIREYHSMEIYKVMGKWLDQYGDTYGFYNGDAPFVVTRDINFVEHVFVRNFQNFVDRGITMVTDQNHPVLKKSILHACGLPWKSIRSCVAQGFSCSKLKQMMPHIEEDASIFIKSLEQYADTGEEVHMLRKFEELSMDYTARGAFGIDERFQGKPDHPLMAIAKATLRGLIKGPFHMIARSARKRALTTEEIITSAAVLFSAGFETTATALSYIAYCLAKHPDVQEKLRREVLDAAGPDGSLDYDTIMKKLKYLEHVVDETLRLYPPGLSPVNRQAKEDFEYNGIKYKAGTNVMAALYQIQRDPRYFSNPLEFNPDRFFPGSEASFTKAALMPFGVGPRNCVGMRLALLKVRYTVAKMVQKYRMELGPSQKGTMELGQYAMVSTPARGPWIVLHSLANEH
ncbi:cytochrome P450 3A14-like isoform X3 [Dermacentor albipictus]|uniref:cytochrome P450 3A14-like isoform X3 n=1 Tax=Dermacentor albipictus TaxID=60249 RepID=UPI0038FC71F9